MNPIQIDQLTRDYGAGRGIFGVSFSVSEGEVFGFLGPNGAGKTTTLECVEGLRSYDSGGVSIHGKTGIQLQSASMPEHIRAMEAVRLFSKWNKTVPADGMLDALGIRELVKKPYYQLSTGQKRRLHLALALTRDPDILFLDEPTSGLDPESAQSVNQLIQELAKREGTTIFLCTHQLRYAQEICTRYGLIEKGRLLITGTLDELREKVHSGTVLQIHANSMPKGLSFRKNEEGPYERIIQSDEEIPRLVRQIVEGGGNIYTVTVKKSSLEDIYFALTAQREDDTL